MNIIKDHRRFDKNMQDMLHERSSHNSIMSATVIIASMDTPVGQYYTPPNMRKLSSLFPMAHEYHLLQPTMQYQPPSHESVVPYALHQMAFDPLAQEYPFWLSSRFEEYW
jgi:hypothetical protein